MSGATIRAARTADAGDYARLCVELATDDPPPTPARIAPLIPRMQIAERDGVVVGYTVASVEAGLGYLRQIVVDPTARRTGLGRALFAAAATRLRALGAARLRLNVKEDNAAAIALYAQMGLRPDYRSAVLWMTHAARRALPGSRTPLALFAPGPADDAAIERRFAMQRGALAHFRASSDPALAARPAGGGEAVAVMRFAAAFPGAYPFCAASPAAARALLLDAEQQVPSVLRYGLVVERDEPLVTALQHAGATLRFHMLQMEGPL